MKSDFLIALTQLAAERDLPRETVLSAIEAALASAYKKDNVAADQNIAVRLNPGTGDVQVFVKMEVVEDVEDPRREMTLAEARKLKSDAAVGDTIEMESTPYMAGRIAAQTAKQVVMQRLREAERELVFEEYAGRADDIVTGAIQRIDAREIVVDLGKAEAVIPEREQVPTERYRPGQKLKVYIVEVAKTAKGPEIILSRSHKNLLRRLFEVEVPEIYNGIVEIKAIAREAGSRSKVAVWARQEGVDAVGSCVGLRGIRIQNIVNELQGEKIDVVQWNRDLAIFVANALNPSQALHVDLNEEEKTATVVVQEKLLSLAIGREGQNARLAAKLTGWKIDILSSAEADMEKRGRTAVAAPTEPKLEPEVEQAPVAEVAAPPTPIIEEQAEVEPEVAAPVAEVQEEPVEAVPAIDEAAVVAEDVVKEAEDVVKEAEEQLEPTPALSPEEELAKVSLQEGQEEQSEQEEEVIPITADVWQVPQLVPSGGAQIRFAEDIMAPRGGEKAVAGEGEAGAGERNLARPGEQQSGVGRAMVVRNKMERSSPISLRKSTMARQRHVPLRRCAACGTQLPQRELIRIVRTPLGHVTVDLERKMAGRGAYLCHSPTCWEQSLKKNRLERVLRVGISPEDRQSLREFASNTVQQA